jgi:Wzt-like putative exopolysaccharide export protein
LRQVVYFHETLSNLNVSYKIRTLQGVDVVFGDTRLEEKISNTYERETIYIFEWSFELNLMHGRYSIMSGLNHPPSAPGRDWVYVDVVPICYQFTMLPRAAGMVDGLVVWKNALHISSLSPSDCSFGERALKFVKHST